MTTTFGMAHRLRARSRAALLATTATFLILAPAAQASKQPVDFFGATGTQGGQFGLVMGGIAVNDTGAGPADPGDIYVLDPTQSRIERFGRDDGGTPGTTPADTADDTYFFISAWGADVIQPGGTGDQGDAAAADYEICTLAAQCQAGASSPGNGSSTGNGSLADGPKHLNASAIAVDPDTGNLYVADAANFRVNVYDGLGNFIRSFGYGVDATTPGSGYEVCPATDVCQAGLSGSGIGQIGLGPGGQKDTAEGIAVSPDGNPAAGTVYLADSGNHRVSTYGLDGSSPSSIGSSAQFHGLGDSDYPRNVTVDSRGILYATDVVPTSSDAVLRDYRVLRYDTTGIDGSGVGFLVPLTAPFDEEQILHRGATAGTYRLSFDPDGAGPQPSQTTADIAFNATTAQVDAALEALPAIGVGGVRVTDCGCVENHGDYFVRFTGPLAATDVSQLALSNGSVPLTGADSVSTDLDGHGGPLDVNGNPTNLAVDPDTDGAGPDSDALYIGRGRVIQQFGPANPPGLTNPPSAEDDRHDTNGVLGTNAISGGIAIEPSTGRLYAATGGDSSANGPAGPGVYVIDTTGPPPTASLDSVDNETSTTADLHATIDPNGPPATRYHFEYVTDATCQADLTASGAGHCFDHASSTPEEFLGAQTDPQAVAYALDPPVIGLDPNTAYHVRMVAGRKFADPILTSELTFTTDPTPPLAETTGTPLRATTTTATLTGRVTPLGSATSFHFEYVTEATCQTDLTASGAGHCFDHATPTPDVSAGSGQLTELAAARLTNLDPDTTYRYRILAQGFGPPVPGQEQTLHTAASDAPLDHGPFPGPPGSDRAWEQVSIPDSSGNPISFVTSQAAFSDAGDRAVYEISGGVPLGTTGSLASPFFAQRPAGEHPTTGWQTAAITPSRDQITGVFWRQLQATDDLSAIFLLNQSNGEAQYWRLSPTSSPDLLSAGPTGLGIFATADDGSRTLNYGSDAEYYDITSGSPQLASPLPGGSLSPCGALPPRSAATAPGGNWVSTDGSRLFFPSQGAGPCGSGGAPSQLYVHEFATAQTKLISGPVLSGPTCEAFFIRSVPGAAFFATQSRLVAADAAPPGCESVDDRSNVSGYRGDMDVYRYDFSDDSVRCLTCGIIPTSPSTAVNLDGFDASTIAVADDGSRLYFSTKERLLPGAPPDGQDGIYRLDIASGSLAYLAPAGVIPTNGIGTSDSPHLELSADGATVAFVSDASFLNPLGGAFQNAGLRQSYLYSDADRSLLCASCPPDGSAPAGAVPSVLFAGAPAVPNRAALAADGHTFAFTTPTPLLAADQNAPGPGHNPDIGDDAYEWRDGRLLLLTDGLTAWPESTDGLGNVLAPSVQGITPSGHDVFFTAPAAYTPDALDDLPRLYDARIGGGIDFPPPGLPPCDLNSGACRGAPSVAHDFSGVGSSVFEGPGNPPPKSTKCPKHKVRRHGRCVPKHHKHKPPRRHHRRAHR